MGVRLLLYSIAHSYYSTHMEWEKKATYCLVLCGGHNLAVGMGSDFDLRDLLKPQLSPALPRWKRTRVSAGDHNHNNSKYADLSSLTYHQHYRTVNGQEYWHVKTIARTLTFQASLITSTTPHWKRTRVLAGQMWTLDLESLTYLPGAG